MSGGSRRMPAARPGVERRRRRSAGRPGARLAVNPGGLTAATLVVLSGLGGLAPPAAAAPAEPERSACLRPTSVHTGQVPWAVQRLRPQRAWGLSRGSGTVVAVLGSGIDARNAQFGPGQVLEGKDLLDDGGPANDDCDGSGTFVAGLVAARPDPATSVVGLSPNSLLLPVRILRSTETGVETPDPATVAAGIDYAVEAGADVVVLYEAASGTSEALRRAVSEAGQRGVVVVAGAHSTGPDRSAPQYPCALDGVLAVAGIDGDGEPMDGSCRGATVDLSAPGADLISTSAGAEDRLGHVPLGDAAAGYAAGYAAGAAALLTAYEPDLDPAGIAARLTRTADLTPSGRWDDRRGWGVVNPYAALTEVGGTAPVGRGRPVGTLTVPEPPSDGTELAPVLWSLGLLTVTAGAVLLAVAFRAGRARRWRPARKDLAARDQDGAGLPSP